MKKSEVDDKRPNFCDGKWCYLCLLVFCKALCVGEWLSTLLPTTKEIKTNHPNINAFYVVQE